MRSKGSFGLICSRHQQMESWWNAYSSLKYNRPSCSSAVCILALIHPFLSNPLPPPQHPQLSRTRVCVCVSETICFGIYIFNCLSNLFFARVQSHGAFTIERFDSPIFKRLCHFLERTRRSCWLTYGLGA